MPKIIKDKQIVNDPWITLADDQDVPAQGDVYVSLARFQQDPSVFEARQGKIGVVANGAVDFPALVEASAKVDAIALNFDKFPDGRSYSHAVLLRTRHGFDGELRASGDILRDQIFFMARCGFDVLALREDKDIEAALKSLEDFSVLYQPSADKDEAVYHHDRPASS